MTTGPVNLCEHAVMQIMKQRLCLGIFLLAATLAGAQTNSATALLQQGLLEEQANRNLDAAIADYQALVAQFDRDRQLAATATFRLGECYRMQGRTNEAAAQYQRILKDFPDQQTLATLSRQDLAGMGTSSSAPAVGSAPAIAGSFTGDDEDHEIQHLQAMIQDSPDLINASGIRGSGPPLIAAAASDHLRVAQFLLDNHADVNIKGAGGDTPLTTAATYGHKAMVELLLNRGADINARNGFDTATALMEAVSHGFESVAAVLIDHKADVNAAYLNGGETALHIAIKKDYVSLVAMLLANGANAMATNGFGQTPLAYAATHYASLPLLINAGANPNAADKNGRTPLIEAAQAGSVKAVDLLLVFKADPNRQDNNGQTALYHVIDSSPETVRAIKIQMLVAAGADPNVADNTGCTPLRYAAGRPSLPMVEALLAAKANPNAGKPDGHGETALNYAVNLGSLEMVQALLAAGADPNSEDDNGRTPLSYAAEKGRPELVQALLAAKADPNGGRQYVPLTMAAHGNDAVSAEYLLKAGADPNVLSLDRRSLLFGALSDTNLLAALLDAGAKVDVTTPDEANVTPLSAAASQNNAPAVAILLKHGANPNVHNSNGATPLHWAVYRLAGTNVLQLLIAAGANPNVRSSNGRTPSDELKQRLLKDDASPEEKVLAGQLADWLRQHGALDDLPHWDEITMARPGLNYSTVVFRKGTNDWDQFTLLELLDRLYYAHAPMPGDQLAFPNLSHITVARPSADGRTMDRIQVNLLDATNNVDVSRDLPLKYGDVVEIPEREHPLNRSDDWIGRQMDEVTQYLQSRAGTAQLIVAGGSPVQLPLAHFEPEDGSLAAALSQPEAQNVLTSDSDLSRVKVTRQGSQEKKIEWTVDCSQAVNAPLSFRFHSFGAEAFDGNQLWLRAGDVIEVPQKQE